MSSTLAYLNEVSNYMDEKDQKIQEAESKDSQDLEKEIVGTSFEPIIKDLSFSGAKTLAKPLVENVVKEALGKVFKTGNPKIDEMIGKLAEDGDVKSIVNDLFEGNKKEAIDGFKQLVQKIKSIKPEDILAKVKEQMPDEVKNTIGQAENLANNARGQAENTLRGAKDMATNARENIRQTTGNEPIDNELDDSLLQDTSRNPISSSFAKLQKSLPEIPENADEGFFQGLKTKVKSLFQKAKPEQAVATDEPLEMSAFDDSSRVLEGARGSSIFKQPLPDAGNTSNRIGDMLRGASIEQPEASSTLDTLASKVEPNSQSLIEQGTNALSGAVEDGRNVISGAGDVAENIAGKVTSALGKASEGLEISGDILDAIPAGDIIGGVLDLIGLGGTIGSLLGKHAHKPDLSQVSVPTPIYGI